MYAIIKLAICQNKYVIKYKHVSLELMIRWYSRSPWKQITVEGYESCLVCCLLSASEWDWREPWTRISSTFAVVYLANKITTQLSRFQERDCWVTYASNLLQTILDLLPQIIYFLSTYYNNKNYFRTYL